MTEKRGRGRPSKPDAKVAVSLRLSPDVLARMRLIGPGWQAHANDVLRMAYLGKEPLAEPKAAPERLVVKPALRVASSNGLQVGPSKSNPGSRLKPDKKGPR